MGGAVAVRTATRNQLPSLAGLIVIDVVEGVKWILELFLACS
jgi:hypothetical protein